MHVFAPFAFRFRSEPVRVPDHHVLAETQAAGELHVETIDGLAPERQTGSLAKSTIQVCVIKNREL